MTPVEKSVFRHYYRKLKKQTRGGKFADGLSGYMPDHSEPGSLLWRGTTRDEVGALADNGRFSSRWSHFLRPKSTRTWVTSRPQIAQKYAGLGGGGPRIYAISPAAFKRVDNKVRDHMSGTTVTAPLRGGIFRHEVRGILKGSDGGLDKYGRKKLRWRPASLGDVQNRNFSARLLSARQRLRELAARSGRLVELGLLGHPLKYSRPHIQGDRSLPRGNGEYQAPEAFRLNNRLESFAPGQEAALARARKNGMISVGLKKVKGGWKGIAEANGLTRAADVKRSVIRHELVHSIQRAKAASKGDSFTRNMLNPVKKYLAEVAAYAAQNRKRPGRSLGERLFPTFKAMLSARRSM